MPILRPALPVLLLLAATAAGCAATIDQPGIEQRTASALGRSVGQFTISDQREVGGGRIEYTATTVDGVRHACELYSATRFQQTMSFGQTPHSSALCTPMDRGAATASPAPACNALLKAAGRCK